MKNENENDKSTQQLLNLKFKIKLKVYKEMLIQNINQYFNCT